MIPGRARFGFVKIVVSDLAAAEQFYGRAFGMTRTGAFATDAIQEVILSGGKGPSLVLYHWRDGRAVQMGSAHGPIGFHVDDVDAHFRWAIECGATPVREPADYGTTRAAFVADPDGHEIELVRHAPPIAPK